MLREATSASNDGACSNDIETAASYGNLGAKPRASTKMPAKVRAEAAARSRLIPGLDAIVATWARLRTASQDLLGVQALACAFYGWLEDDEMQEPADRWLTDEAVGRSQRRSDDALT